MNQIHIIHPLIWIMLLTHHQNYHSNQDHVFQCHVLAMIRYFFLILHVGGNQNRNTK